MKTEQFTELWPGWNTVQMLGRGSFGAVYEIRRNMMGETEKAAMKVISIPEKVGEIDTLINEGYDAETVTATFQSHLKSILQEYQLMRKLNGCTNVVNCDDVRYVQQDNGIGWDIFIKMELLTPLLKALPSQITDDLVIKIGKDICNALLLCAKHNIVHRDIKPQNIFVSTNGDYKLGDFGIAKIVEKTTEGTKAGTPYYMAPEVYNNQPYGFSADIYSLGMVMYWLMNERRFPLTPLPPEKILPKINEEAFQRRMRGEAVPPPKNGSEELKRVVLKACAFRAKDRYHTADEFIEALENISRDVPLQPINWTKWIIVAAIAAALAGTAYFIMHKNEPGITGPEITDVDPQYTTSTTAPSVPIPKETLKEEANQSDDTALTPSQEIPQAKAETIMKVANCDDWITLYAENNVHSEERFKIPLNEKVWYLSDADNGFAKVEYNGIVGYVMSKYMQFACYKESVDEFSEFFPKTMTIRNCKESVTLRAEASATSAELLQVPLGSAVKVLSFAQNRFYFVEYKGVSGYILTKYVEY